MQIRVAVVENDRRYRESLDHIFKNTPSLKTTGFYSAGKEAIQGVLEHQPDVALVDLGLPDISGIDVIREVTKSGSKTELLVLTVYNDDTHLFSALEAGAVGYILKSEASPAEIVNAIKDTVKGGAPMSMSLARRILKELRSKAEAAQRPELKELTKREIELLEYLSRGCSTRKAADALHISYDTVRSHQKNIYRKLQVNSILEAVAVFRG